MRQRVLSHVAIVLILTLFTLYCGAAVADGPPLPSRVSIDLPKDFVLTERNAQGTSWHYVPEGQSLKNWDQRVSVLIYGVTSGQAGLEKTAVKEFMKDLESKCGSVTSETFANIPYSPDGRGVTFTIGAPAKASGIVYCDDLDKSKVHPRLHVRRNGVQLTKVMVLGRTLYVFQYNWQSDDRPSEFVKSSGLLDKVVFPMMARASVR